MANLTKAAKMKMALINIENDSYYDITEGVLEDEYNVVKELSETGHLNSYSASEIFHSEIKHWDPSRRQDAFSLAGPKLEKENRRQEKSDKTNIKQKSKVILHVRAKSGSPWCGSKLITGFAETKEKVTCPECIKQLGFASWLDEWTTE